MSYNEDGEVLKKYKLFQATSVDSVLALMRTPEEGTFPLSDL